MVAFPERNTRVTRALWLTALTALFLFGAPPARAEEKAPVAAKPSRPPVSSAAVEASTETKPTTTKSSDTGAKAVTATPTASKVTSSKATDTKPTNAKSTDTKPESEGGMTLRAGQDRTDFRSSWMPKRSPVSSRAERPT